MDQLNETQARLAAASLEIDGRPNNAAQAAITGHIEEFTHRHGEPDSPKAKRQEELKASIAAAIETDGLPAVITALRQRADTYWENRQS
jgi:hypothetical protein